MARKAGPHTASGTETAGERLVIEREDLPALWPALEARGFTVVGPTVRDGAIVYDRLASVEELPIGWTDEQDGGRYRLKRRDDEALFGYAVGPRSWKAYLHPPRLCLWRGRREGPGFAVETGEEEPPRYAFLGVRPCELAAIAIQDRVFLGGAFVDSHYRRRREGVFLVAVDCAAPAATCFCASMNTGPSAAAGFDLALTEFPARGRHHFLARAGTPRGAEVLGEVPRRAATAAERKAAESQARAAAARMGRKLDTVGLPEFLQESYDHPHWADVARRCLTCGNCTLVCPTCFCSAVEDRTDLSGQRLERWRRWDSCFTLEFSYLFGGSVRASAAARYRQWLTHKLGTWHEQFGSAGCVGCGRCITWCPVGIDITEEVRALRATASGRPAAPHGQGEQP